MYHTVPHRNTQQFSFSPRKGIGQQPDRSHCHRGQHHGSQTPSDSANADISMPVKNVVVSAGIGLPVDLSKQEGALE